MQKTLLTLNFQKNSEQLKIYIQKVQKNNRGQRDLIAMGLGDGLVNMFGALILPTEMAQGGL